MRTNYLLIVTTLLAFLGTNSEIFAQTSWTKDPNNPVLRRDTIVASLPNDIYAISDCWVLKEGNVYKMWYTGGGFNYPPDTLMRSRICYATSTDGVNWNKYVNNPVLDVSYTGGWDSLGVETVSIIIDSLAPSNQRYKMWYAGQTYNSYRYEIGYAYSPDGMSWTKHANPVLQVGASNQWDNGFLEGPSVIKDGSGYKMWYCGYDVTVDGNSTDGKANLGYATSNDGINWIKYAGNPVLVTGTNGWDSIYVQDPHVIKEGAEYHMWYGGGQNGDLYDQQVGYATSLDGITWVKSPLNPVLTRGESGDWDEILSSFPSVLNDNGEYKMWYTGRNIDPLPSSFDYYWELGYASGPVLGIENSSNETQNTIVFPNPAKSVLTVSVSYDENYTIVVRDILGHNLIISENLNTIDVSDLSQGIYIVDVIQGKEMVSEKFIKE